MIQTIISISEFATKLVAGLSGVFFGALILGLVVAAKNKKPRISIPMNSNARQKISLSKRKNQKRKPKRQRTTKFRTRNRKKTIRKPMQPSRNLQTTIKNENTPSVFFYRFFVDNQTVK